MADGLQKVNSTDIDDILDEIEENEQKVISDHKNQSENASNMSFFLE